MEDLIAQLIAEAPIFTAAGVFPLLKKLGEEIGNLLRRRLKGKDGENLIPILEKRKDLLRLCRGKIILIHENIGLAYKVEEDGESGRDIEIVGKGRGKVFVCLYSEGCGRR